PAVDAALAAGPELGVLNVEGSDSLVVVVDEGEVVEALQYKVAGVIVNGAARMAGDALQEHLERQAVVQILRRMDLVADVHALGVEGIQNRTPAAGELVEALVYESVRPLR